MKCYKNKVWTNKNESQVTNNKRHLASVVGHNSADNIIDANGGYDMSRKANGEPSNLYSRLIDKGITPREAMLIRARLFTSVHLAEDSNSTRDGVPWPGRHNGSYELIPQSLSSAINKQDKINSFIPKAKDILTSSDIATTEDGINILYTETSQLLSDETVDVNNRFPTTGTTNSAVSLVGGIIHDFFTHVEAERIKTFKEADEYVNDVALIYKRLDFTNPTILKSAIIESITSIIDQYKEDTVSSKSMEYVSFLTKLKLDVAHNSSDTSILSKALAELNLEINLDEDTQEVKFEKVLYLESRLDYDVNAEIPMELRRYVANVPNVLNGIPVRDTNTGIVSSRLVDVTLKTLRNVLTGAYNEQSMLKRLRVLSLEDMSYAELFTKFEASLDTTSPNNDGGMFAALLYSTFRKQTNKVIADTIMASSNGNLKHAPRMLTSSSHDADVAIVMDDIRSRVETMAYNEDSMLQTMAMLNVLNSTKGINTLVSRNSSNVIYANKLSARLNVDAAKYATALNEVLTKFGKANTRVINKGTPNERTVGGSGTTFTHNAVVSMLMASLEAIGVDVSKKQIDRLFNSKNNITSGIKDMLSAIGRVNNNMYPTQNNIAITIDLANNNKSDADIHGDVLDIEKPVHSYKGADYTGTLKTYVFAATNTILGVVNQRSTKEVAHTYIDIERKNGFAISPGTQLSRFSDFVNSLESHTDPLFIDYMNKGLQSGELAFSTWFNLNIHDARDANGMPSVLKTHDRRLKVAFDSLKQFNVMQYGGYKNDSYGAKYANSNNNDYLLSLASIFANTMRTIDSNTTMTVRTSSIIHSDSSISNTFRHTAIGSLATGEVMDTGSSVALSPIRFNTDEDGNTKIVGVSGLIRTFARMLGNDVYTQERETARLFKTVSETVGGNTIDILVRRTDTETKDGFVDERTGWVFKGYTEKTLLKDTHYTVNRDTGAKEFLTAAGMPTGRYNKMLVFDEFNIDDARIDTSILFDATGRFIVNSTQLKNFHNQSIDSYINQVFNMKGGNAIIAKIIEVFNSKLNKMHSDIRTDFTDIKQETIDLLNTSSGAISNSPMYKQLSSLAVDPITKKAVDNKVFDMFISSYSINTFVSNFNQKLMFAGQDSFYKNAEDTVKRAKGWVAPALDLSVAGFAENELNLDIIIMADPVLGSKYISGLKGKVPKAMLDIFKEQYGRLEIGDGAGYINEHGYANYLRQKGDSETLFRLFNKNETTGKYSLKKDIDVRDSIAVAKPIKPFINIMYFNEQLGINHPFQVKDSLILITEDFANFNPEMRKLLDVMDETGAEHAVFNTAVKMGAHNVNDMFDKNGTLTNTTNIDTVTIKRSDFNNQMEVSTHHVDTTVKAGIQIFKLMFTNIKANDTYTVNGKTYKGKQADGIIDHMFGLLGQLIKNSSMSLIEELTGRTNVTDTSDMALSDTNIRDLLLKLPNARLTSADKALLEIDDVTGKFVIPLDYKNSERWDSLMGSAFNRVTNIKIPGMHNVMMSGAMFDKSQFKASDGVKLKVIPAEKTADGITVYEAMVPRWSKDFYDKETGEPIPFDRLDDSIKKMIAYRIPTSAKHSAVVIKVVGFTDDNAGSIIMLPDEIIGRTGADFDIDTLYINLKKHYNDGGTFKAIPYNHYTASDITNNILLKNNGTYASVVFKKYMRKNHKYELDMYYAALRDQAANSLNYNNINDIVKANADTSNVMADKDDANFYIELIEDAVDAIGDIQDKTVLITNETSNLQDLRENEASTEAIEAKEAELDLLIKEGVALDRELDIYVINIVAVISDVNELDTEATDALAIKLAKVFNDTTANKLPFNDNEKLALAFNTIKPQIAEFLALSINEQNDNAALTNELVDGMSAILGSNNHLIEATMAAAFHESKNAAADVTAMRSDGVPINTYEGHSQLMFKGKATTPKANLGIFANKNSINAIYQHVNAEFSDIDGVAYRVKITYDVSELLESTKIKTKAELLATLKDKYGAQITEENNDIITIAYNKIGHNDSATDTFIGIRGKGILEDYGQLVDHMPDAVKDPIMDNLNPTTTTLLNQYGMVGDISHGLYLIGQDAMTEVNKLTTIKTSTSASVTGNVYNKVRRKYASDIIATDAIIKYVSSIVDVASVIADISTLQKKQVNGVTIVESMLTKQLAMVHSELNTITNTRNTMSNIKYLLSTHDLKGKNYTTIGTSVKDILAQARLNKANDTMSMLKGYIKTGSKITNRDVTVTGSNIIDHYMSQISVLNQIEADMKVGAMISEYDRLLRFDKVGIASNNANTDMLNELHGFKSDLHIVGVNTAGVKVNMIDAIYTSGKLRPVAGAEIASAYSVLQDYAIHTNVAYRDLMKNAFVLNKDVPAYDKLATDLIELFGSKSLDTKTAIYKAISNTAIFMSIVNGDTSSNTLNVTTDEVKRLIGYNKTTPAEIKLELPLNEFKLLSLSEKLQYYRLHKDINEFDIVNMLLGKIDRYTQGIYKFQRVLVKNMLTETNIVQHTAEDLYAKLVGSNEFDAALATDIIKYNYTVNGGGMSFNGMTHLISPMALKYKSIDIAGALRSLESTLGIITESDVLHRLRNIMTPFRSNLSSDVIADMTDSDDTSSPQFRAYNMAERPGTYTISNANTFANSHTSLSIFTTSGVYSVPANNTYMIIKYDIGTQKTTVETVAFNEVAAYYDINTPTIVKGSITGVYDKADNDTLYDVYDVSDINIENC